MQLHVLTLTLKLPRCQRSPP